jgi:hypothetical protein
MQLVLLGMQNRTFGPYLAGARLPGSRAAPAVHDRSRGKLAEGQCGRGGRAARVHHHSVCLPVTADGRLRTRLFAMMRFGILMEGLKSWMELRFGIVFPPVISKSACRSVTDERWSCRQAYNFLNPKAIC